MVTSKNTRSILRNLNVSKEVKSLKIQKVVHKLIYFLSLFEYLFKNNFAVHFFWTTGFISWVVGSSLWVLKAEFISLAFISISIILCLIALFDSSKKNLSESYDLKKLDELGISVYTLIIVSSVLIMIIFNSIAIGLTTNILLILFFYNWKVYEKSK
jgi:hypothetical protein